MHFELAHSGRSNVGKESQEPGLPRWQLEQEHTCLSSPAAGPAVVNLAEDELSDLTQG